MVFLCVVFVSSCSNDSNIQKAPSEAEPIFPDAPVSLDKRVFKNTYGKYGLLDENANIIIEPVYEKASRYENIIIFTAENGKNVIINYFGEILGEYDRIEKASVIDETYFIACNIDGTRNELDPNDYDSINIVEVENTDYYALNALGELIFEESYSDLAIGLGKDENIHIFAVRNGSRYEYVKFETIWELAEEYHPGETGFEFFGYREICYYWNIPRTGHGLVDSESNIIFEPVYDRIRMFFADRVLLYYGDSAAGEGVCCITTLEGKNLAQFGNVSYTVFGDGSYVGIAFANEAAGNFDPDGTVTYGWYFVDKDGRIISELFLSAPNFGNRNVPSSSTDTFTATTENGEEVILSVKDYVCES